MRVVKTIPPQDLEVDETVVLWTRCSFVEDGDCSSDGKFYATKTFWGGQAPKVLIRCEKHYLDWMAKRRAARCSIRTI